MCISHHHHTINHMFNGGLQFNLNDQDVSRLMKLCSVYSGFSRVGCVVRHYAKRMGATVHQRCGVRIRPIEERKYKNGTL
jgi:hypothetical protein